jgi:ribosomal-protein-alanine N-acetyltransferase
MISGVKFIFSAENISAENLEMLALLDQKFFPTPWDIASWKTLFTGSPRLLSFTKLEDDIIGFALFDINTVDSFAHLLKIAIVPKYKNKGFAKALFGPSIDKLLNEQKIRNFFLEVEVTNQDAIGLYLKFGFKIIHTKKDFYGTRRDAYVMTLVLP